MMCVARLRVWNRALGAVVVLAWGIGVVGVGGLGGCAVGGDSLVMVEPVFSSGRVVAGAGMAGDMWDVDAAVASPRAATVVATARGFRRAEVDDFGMVRLRGLNGGAGVTGADAVAVE